MGRISKIVFFSLVVAMIWAGIIGCGSTCADYYFCPDGRDEVGGGGTSGAGNQGGSPEEGGFGGTGGQGETIGISNVGLCPVDPAGGPVAQSCGIWVSAALGDDNNAGTQAEPVQTIARAIELAESGSRRVYACGGDGADEIYVEAAAVPSGISLHGGFDCTNDWQYAGKSKKAVIAPLVGDVVPLTVVNGGDLSFITDIRFEAADAIAPGGSSIAVLAVDDSELMLQRVDLITGNGADGADGAPGDPKGFAAPKGLPGDDGADACTADVGAGGESKTVMCPAGSGTTGGFGGDGGELVASDGASGKFAPIPNPLNYGAAGKAEDLSSGTGCTPGFGGAHGVGGIDGLGGLGAGTLTLSGYVGAPGMDGTAGLPGQGGGGGGASIGNALCGPLFHGGAGGGAGGLGGCGGMGGKGGQGGGSSFGLAVRYAKVTLIETTIIVGNGGNGGNGGAHQAGGNGGLPGLGGLGFGSGSAIKGGCVGGAGGQGGNGGFGGGGNGGHSAAYAVVGSPSKVVPIGGPAPVLGASGKGGIGAGQPWTNGKLGDAEVLLVLDP